MQGKFGMSRVHAVGKSRINWLHVRNDGTQRDVYI